ncbi:MAG: hypothetical protein HGA23_10115 [Bacteroidales bacterium]|nr:hypothetical protein [Bacteroidales bacterium]
MKYKALPVLLIFLASFHFIASGQAVKIGCTEVMPGGDVLIHWNPLQIGSSFSDYTIYTSDHLAGPFTVLATITIMDQDSYLHAGAGANNDTVFYYIETDQGGGGTTLTDTLATMLLAASTIDFEVVDFSWTPLHSPSPFLPDMYPWYFLFREFPPGNWAIVDSTQK